MSLFPSWLRHKPSKKTQRAHLRHSPLRVECLEDRVVLTTVTSVSPVAGVIEVGVSNPIKATFDVALNPSTVNTNTFILQDSQGHNVAGAVAYDSTSNTAIIQPNAALSYTQSYTATVIGGSGGVKDTQGNPLSSNYVVEFPL